MCFMSPIGQSLNKTTFQLTQESNQFYDDVFQLIKDGAGENLDPIKISDFNRGFDRTIAFTRWHGV